MRKISVETLQLAVLLTVVVSVPVVYALSVLWSSQVSVNIPDTVALSVYADQACTTPATAIAFGDQVRGIFKLLSALLALST